MYEQFKEYMFDDAIKKTFHLYKFGLCILSPITEVKEYYDDAGVEAKFNGGEFHVWKDNKIIKCSRPANLIRTCENCYSLHNEYGDHIGYVYN